jgi:hypothetical protein
VEFKRFSTAYALIQINVSGGQTPPLDSATTSLNKNLIIFSSYNHAQIQNVLTQLTEDEDHVNHFFKSLFKKA